ncbi:Protein of unknown function [Gryllus bimaculatus]|nr:Protein of unknown function [Gryllus bimaculatus]
MDEATEPHRDPPGAGCGPDDKTCTGGEKKPSKHEPESLRSDIEATAVEENGKMEVLRAEQPAYAKIYRVTAEFPRLNQDVQKTRYLE